MVGGGIFPEIPPYDLEYNSPYHIGGFIIAIFNAAWHAFGKSSANTDTSKYVATSQ
jgi:hypothetical protein